MEEKKTAELWKHQKDAIEKAKNKNNFALLFDPGCLGPHTKIKVNRGGGSREYTIEQCFRLFNSVELDERELGWSHDIDSFVRSFNGDSIGLHKIKSIVRSGEKRVLRLVVGQLPPLVCTYDHKIMTDLGWVEAGNLIAGVSMVMVDRTERWQKKSVTKKPFKPRYTARKVGEFHPYKRWKKHHYHDGNWVVDRHRLVFEASLNSLSLEDFIKKTERPNTLKFINPKTHHIHHKNHNSNDDRIENLECLLAVEHQRLHGDASHFGHGQPAYNTVSDISDAGVMMTYDISCEDPHHNFVANGIVVHNCGKTRTVLNILRDRYNEHKKIEKTLIVAPGITLQNWRNEILQYTKIPQEKVVVLQGTGVKRIKTFCLETATDENKIVICNYETISVMKKIRATLVKWKPKYVVADEMHKIKDYKSVRAEGMREVSLHSEYRYGLTGTAILNNYMDLFGQWLWLDRGSTFGTNFFVFRGKYYLDKNSHMPRHIHFPKFEPRSGVEDQIKDLIQPMSAKALKSECLDLPPLIKKKVFVEMTGPQAKSYKEMKDHMLTWMSGADSAVVASTALTKVIRLMQITSGFVKTEDGEEILFDKNPKGEALHELLETIHPNKVIIWATFKRSYEVIRSVCAKLKIRMVECHGDTPNAQKFKNVDAFNNDPEIGVFLGHPQSLGIGINLVAASYMVYFDRNFSLENDIQSEARNYRAGSEVHGCITRYDLVAKNTVDELCLTMLDKKSEVSASILKNWMELEHELNEEDG